MSDIVVKTERFIGFYHDVQLLTIESDGKSRYYSIINDKKVEYISPDFYGGSHADVVRNCESALQVVRQLLTDTSFLRGEVVGA